MSAIVNFCTFRQRRLHHTLLTDRVTQAAMAEFNLFPLSAIEAGIAAGNSAICEGKDFAEAMVAARRAVIRHAAGSIDRNALRMAAFYERRQAHAQDALRVITPYLQRRFAGAALAEATARAQRVLVGGGTFSTAMRHALNLGDDQ